MNNNPLSLEDIEYGINNNRTSDWDKLKLFSRMLLAHPLGNGEAIFQVFIATREDWYDGTIELTFIKGRGKDSYEVAKSFSRICQGLFYYENIPAVWNVYDGDGYLARFNFCKKAGYDIFVKSAKELMAATEAGGEANDKD